MMPSLTVICMTLAAVGGGMATLRAVGLLPALSISERIAIGFALGIGMVGWLAFFAGLFGAYSAPAFIAILIALSPGLVFLKLPARQQAQSTLTTFECLLILGIVVALAMNFLQALSPAADADSMAYHFETPRRFLAEHKIFAVHRAADGVTQLLLQLTYGMALGLGGKAAVPLWAMTSGWSLAAVFYVICRRYAGRLWALAGTLIVISTPAVVYAAGTGQVEVRVAAFALLGAYAAALAVNRQDTDVAPYGWLIIAGIAAGFFAGAKMTGLIFVFATAVALIGQQNSLRRMVIFSIIAAIAGGQWYLFNWQQTGDPLYPLLWQHVALKPGFEWNQVMADSMAMMWEAEGPLPRNILWFLAYPFRTIIAPMTGFESLLTGVGPASLLFLPFAVIGLLKYKPLPETPLVRVFVIALLFYSIWFFFGPSLRLRHLLPVYPIVLACLIAGMHRYTQLYRHPRFIIMMGTALLIAMQLAGQVVFTKKYATYLVSTQQADSFLNKNISGYPVVKWINENLSKDDRVLVSQRDWLYLLDVPYFMAHPSLQTGLDLQSGTHDVAKFVGELKALGITHAAINEAGLNSSDNRPLDYFINNLENLQCITRRARLHVDSLGSRTLPELELVKKSFLIFDLNLDLCLKTLNQKAVAH